MKTQISWRRAVLRILIIMIAALLPNSLGMAKEAAKAALPKVYAAAAPIYPHVARMANVQGVVRVKVVTDGQAVISTSIENRDANPILAKAAQENVRTWKFSVGAPATFSVTYRYALVAKLKDIKSSTGNSKVVLRFPTDVEVFAERWPESSDIHVRIKD